MAGIELLGQLNPCKMVQVKDQWLFRFSFPTDKAGQANCNVVQLFKNSNQTKFLSNLGQPSKKTNSNSLEACLVFSW